MDVLTQPSSSAASAAAVRSVAVVGATGYAGAELCGLVAAHPEMRLASAMSARAEGGERAATRPGEFDVTAYDPEVFADVDGVFVCAPHGASAPAVLAALAAGARVVDLSADFRLSDPSVYASAYGAPHPAPERLADAVYGLTERARDRVAAARLVANPGCYPTSILTPLLPLYDAGLVARDTLVVADSKSGVSGAGKAPNERTHFGNVHDNFLAYGVGTHRHTPEIHEHAGTRAIRFVPHLLPVFRGILSTIYVQPLAGTCADDVRDALAKRYADETFVRVLDAGATPQLADVQRTNRCDLAVCDADGVVVILSAIDNLVKGAAGQALQNMNLMLGLDEAAALPGAKGLPGSRTLPASNASPGSEDASCAS